MDGLATMESGDEQDVVTGLEFVFFFALELPVGVIDEHKDSGSAISFRISKIRTVFRSRGERALRANRDIHMIVENEELGSGIFHLGFAEVVDEKADVRRLAVAVSSRDRQ